jgi:tryptophan synthase alpha chain
MTSAIDQVFDRLRGSGRCAFIPYLTGGFPDRATCVDILVALGNSGADIIEVGIPFSDPLADGPAIQWASRKALDNGMTVRGVFELVREARPRVAAPIVIMTYCNPLFAMGPAKFAAKAREAGVSGVIVPDLPVDEAEPWLDAASSHGLDTIFLAAPNTTLPRMREIVARTKGFLYYVSMTGVTGSSLTLTESLFQHISRIRSLSDIPVGVGFGVSSPEDARALAAVADAVIVGSEIIRRISAEKTTGSQVAAAARLAGSLNDALKNGGAGASPRATRQGVSFT